MKSFSLILLGIVTLSFNDCYAQAIGLDSTFGNNGIVITSAMNSSEINAIAIQLDNKIVAAGNSNYLGEYHFLLARYNTDGSLDNNFGSGGLVNTMVGFVDMPDDILIQPDGKIIAAGHFFPITTPPNGYHAVLVRYNENGVLDNSFGNGGIVTIIVDSLSDGILSIALADDGKILAGGFAGNQCLLMRYNTNGTLDNSFGAGGKVLTSVDFMSSISSIVLQDNGKVVVSGSARNDSNTYCILARYNINGALDTDFGIGGVVINDFDTFSYDNWKLVTLQPDGKIIAAGYSNNYLLMGRYHTDGTLDVSFGIGGKVVSDTIPAATDLLIQSDGKIIISGSVQISTYNNGYSLTRFNSNGTLDSTFGSLGNIKFDIKSRNDYAQCLTLQLDQKFIVAGSSRDSSNANSNFTLARFTNDISDIDEIPTSADYWKLYPNPFSNILNIKALAGIYMDIPIVFTLFDITGRKILVSNIHSEQTDINTHDIPAGLYIYNITNREGSIIRGKAVKQ